MNSNWSYSPETVKLGCDLCDLDLWPWSVAWTSLLSLVITPENFVMIQWWEHGQKGVTDRQTDRRTENTIHRAAWSQLKIGLLVYTQWVGVTVGYPRLSGGVGWGNSAEADTENAQTSLHILLFTATLTVSLRTHQVPKPVVTVFRAPTRWRGRGGHHSPTERRLTVSWRAAHLPTRQLTPRNNSVRQRGFKQFPTSELWTETDWIQQNILNQKGKQRYTCPLWITAPSGQTV